VIWELYGGTELQALTFISGDQWLTHRGSVGVVVAGEMKVLDDDGNQCAPGQVGEVYMRPSPGSAPTYRYVGATAKSRDAGTRWATSATSTPTGSCTYRTAVSTCSPWRAQRLPRRDRGRAVGAPGSSVVSGCRRPRSELG